MASGKVIIVGGHDFELLTKPSLVNYTRIGEM